MKVEKGSTLFVSKDRVTTVNAILGKIAPPDWGEIANKYMPPAQAPLSLLSALIEEPISIQAHCYTYLLVLHECVAIDESIQTNAQALYRMIQFIPMRATLEIMARMGVIKFAASGDWLAPDIHVYTAIEDPVSKEKAQIAAIDASPNLKEVADEKYKV